MTAAGEDRDVVTWVGLGVVGAAAAVMSFTALADLARICGITATLGRMPVAWLLPLTIDVLAAVSTRVWLRRRTNTDALAYARRSAWAAIGATVVGNGAHGALVHAASSPPWWAAVLVSAVPAVALGAMVHLAVLVGRGVASPPADVIDQPDRRPGSASPDEHLVADLRSWIGEAGPVGRDRIMSAYGIGASRAMRIKQTAESLEAVS